MGGSPFSNLLCAPSTAPAASSLSNPRRDTYRGRTAPRGRAGRLHRGPTSQGPWPRRERAGAEGQQSTSTWPQAGLGHIQLRVAVAPGFSAEALGARECNSGTLRGEGASQASPVTSSELEGAQLRAGGASTTPDWCPHCRICAASGSRTCGPGTRRPPASLGLPGAKCCVFQLRGPARIRTRSRVRDFQHKPQFLLFR